MVFPPSWISFRKAWLLGSLALSFPSLVSSQRVEDWNDGPAILIPKQNQQSLLVAEMIIERAHLLTLHFEIVQAQSTGH